MSRDVAPNVLLITADHWPAAVLGCAGHPVVQTPTLNQLARNGVRYTNAYAECPVCIPARRSLLTGLSPRAHGDRTFQTTLRMPEAPTVADYFREHGYQTQAVGKLHVYPQRSRAGFDEVLLAEEGRPYWGCVDDYDVYLGDRGFAGRQFDHAMSNNEYVTRTWHLPEDCHVTHWIAEQMCRQIRRRDPDRPGFWYCSFTHPHPPLVPPAVFWDMYAKQLIESPFVGRWARDSGRLPWRLRLQQASFQVGSGAEYQRALQAFFALCTQIDFQIRRLVGTLREEGLLEQTVILFSSDHGDMLGQHGLWAKRLFYEPSANVPWILVGARGDSRLPAGTCDDRLVGWQDVLPTLLDACHLPLPTGITGLSAIGRETREYLYGECNEDELASRMIRSGDWKLIYYPAGNRLQLFNLETDPQECVDLGDDPEYSEVRRSLVNRLLNELHGSDQSWVFEGELRGLVEPPDCVADTRDLSLQRGIHWPPPPTQVISQQPNRLK